MEFSHWLILTSPVCVSPSISIGKTLTIIRAVRKEEKNNRYGASLSHQTLGSLLYINIIKYIPLSGPGT